MRTAIAVGLLLASVSVFAQGGGPPPQRWQELVSRDKRFSVSMPGEAAFKTQSLTAKNGHQVQYSSYTVDLGRSAYMTSFSDYDDQTSISLDGAIEGVLSAWKEPKMLSRKKTTLYGYPAQIVEFTSESYHVIVHAFVVGQRLYQLGFVEMSSDFARGHANTFMDSFRLR